VTLEQAADAVLSLVAHGLEATQNRFNAPARPHSPPTLRTSARGSRPAGDA
jgi:hypothetical protein